MEVTYYIVLTPAQIKLCSYNFKFYDVEEQKIRDCAIYSRFHHFSEGGISFELNGNVYSNFIRGMTTKDIYLNTTHIISAKTNGMEEVDLIRINIC